MFTLTLTSIERAISEAFQRYLDQTPTSFVLNLEGRTVLVDVSLVGDRFNCGIPGYNMANAYEQALRLWVPQNIYHGSDRGRLSPCKDGAVNVWLKCGWEVMFNFHVHLVDPCT